MIDPSTLGPPPRKVKIRSTYIKGRAIFSGVLTALGAVILIGCIYNLVPELLFVERAHTVAGEVISRTSSRRRMMAYLVIEYPRPAPTIQDFSIADAEAAAYKPGSSIPISIDPSNSHSDVPFHFGFLQALEANEGWFLGMGAYLLLLCILSSAEKFMTKSEAECLANWNSATFTVTHTGWANQRNGAYELKGTYIRDSVETSGTIDLSFKEHPVGSELPILYGPGHWDLVLLETIKHVQLA